MRHARITILVTLAALALAVNTAAQAKPHAVAGERAPALKSIVPDVVTAKQQNASVTLKGRRVSTVSVIRIVDCTGKSLALPLEDHIRSRVVLPASILTEACVIRIGLETGPLLPVGVAEPELANLPVPKPDPDGNYDWSGQFNLVVDQVQVPQRASSVAISWQGKQHRTVIFGKGEHAIAHLTSLPAKPMGTDPVTAEYFALPGVEAEDVQWGPHDIENFWIGTLSADGKQIVDRQYLSEMVQEPSGELDKPQD